MASVHNTQTSKYARRGVMEDEPLDHLESAGDLLIKQLVQKQTNTSLTLEQQLREEKQFERGVGLVSLDELASGTSSLQHFQELRQKAETLIELEGRGLSKTEALALVAREQQSKAAPEAQVAAQKYINQCLDIAQPNIQCIGEKVKRQEWELALCVKPNSLETRLYQFAVNNAQTRSQLDSPPSDHPIHHLKTMEQNLMKTADPQSLAKTFRRKRRQQVESQTETQELSAQPKVPIKLNSLWDATEKPLVVTKKPRQQETVVTCKKQTFYTIKGTKIVQLDDSISSVAETKDTKSKYKPSGQAFVALPTLHESLEVSGRLSEEELKQLPRFQNYKRGEVSKTLYIKNLSRSMTEADLAAVFSKFQDPIEGQIIYRLMNGKMRGQAFAIFTSRENAATALEAINGTILKGKPIVIQFGRQHQT